MSNQDVELTTIMVAQKRIEHVTEYIYLGPIVKLNKENRTVETKH